MKKYLWVRNRRTFFLPMHTTHYHIGCSGYYYSYWKNRFYPQGLAAKNWLQHYSTIFDTVELNGTFYRTPRVSTLKKYAEQTPEHFRFSAKINKYFTHIVRLKDMRQQIREFCMLLHEGLENKLACLLYQMPPSFHYTEENLERIIENLPHHPQNVIEFRHISWWNTDVEQTLKNANISFCNVDFPGIKSSIISTTDHFYFRFHGNPLLFKSSYSDKTLQELLLQFPSNAKQSYVYFNNTYYEAGYQNALSLQKMVEEKKH